MKILIIRNDKLGDFILSFPVFSLLKQHLPDSKLHAFVPKYTSEIALQFNCIDQVIIDPGTKSKFLKQVKTLKNVRNEKYDAIITLYSTTRIGVFSFLSGTKYRLAPATKFAQIFYNHRLVQQRSRSQKPEYEYNLDLAIKFLEDQNIHVSEKPQAPLLQFHNTKNAKNTFYKEHNLMIRKKLIFIHPGTGGSATNLNLEQYAQLSKNLNIDDRYYLIITAGPDEYKYAKQLSELLNDIPHTIYHSTKGIVNFAKVIQLGELFISGSTGTLHIAGALDVPTAAFYQRRRSATPLRWQTLNSEGNRLAFVPPEGAHESDLTKIDVLSAANKINEKFLKVT